MKRNRSNFLRWRHDIQINDFQLNITGYNDTKECPKVPQSEEHSFAVMLNVIVLSVVILSAVFLSFVFPNVIILSVFILSVIILSAIILSVLAPFTMAS